MPKTPKKSRAAAAKAPLRILVLHRGFVVMGRVQATAAEVIVTEAACIRRWGTSKGLGQLATEGKQPNTQLDPCGTVRVHPLAVIQQIDCVESAWAAR